MSPSLAVVGCTAEGRKITGVSFINMQRETEGRFLSQDFRGFRSTTWSHEGEQWETFGADTCLEYKGWFHNIVRGP